MTAALQVQGLPKSTRTARNIGRNVCQLAQSSRLVSPCQLFCCVARVQAVCQQPKVDKGCIRKRSCLQQVC